MGGNWLPGEIEIILLQNGQVIVSELQENPNIDESHDTPKNSTWLLCDGVVEEFSDVPASEKKEFLSKLSSPVASTHRMGLVTVISSIFSEKEEGISGDKHKGHPILHMKLPEDPSSSQSRHEWHCFNDFQVTKESFEDTTTFFPGHLQSYRHPSVIFFALINSKELIISPLWTSVDINIPSSVFNIQSLSAVPSIRPSLSSLPKRGDIIAFDGEFVSVEAAKKTVDSSGKCSM